MPVRRLVVAALLVGGLAWAALTPPGLQGRLDDLLGRGRDVVEGALVEPNLRRAQQYLDRRYSEEGAYPLVSEADLREATDLDWGAGTLYFRCSDQHVVVRSLTARGTVSRLLVRGESWGDVPGAADCPMDVSAPTPWTVPAR